MFLSNTSIEYSPSDIKLGRLLAKSVHDVINLKMKVEDVLIRLDPKPKVVVNRTTVLKLQIDIPDKILKSAVIVE